MDGPQLGFTVVRDVCEGTVGERVVTDSGESGCTLKRDVRQDFIGLPIEQRDLFGMQDPQFGRRFSEGDSINATVEYRLETGRRDGLARGDDAWVGDGSLLGGESKRSCQEEGVFGHRGRISIALIDHKVTINARFVTLNDD